MRACARDFLARFFPGERFGRHAACEQLRAGACACASRLSCSCPVGWVAAPDRPGRKNRREGAQEGVAPPRMRVWAPHLAPGLALCTSEQGSTARAAPARSASSLSTRSSSSPHGRAGFTKFRVLPDNGDSCPGPPFNLTSTEIRSLRKDLNFWTDAILVPEKSAVRNLREKSRFFISVYQQPRKISCRR